MEISSFRSIEIHNHIILPKIQNQCIFFTFISSSHFYFLDFHSRARAHFDLLYVHITYCSNIRALNAQKIIHYNQKEYLIYNPNTYFNDYVYHHHWYETHQWKIHIYNTNTMFRRLSDLLPLLSLISIRFFSHKTRKYRLNEK